MTWVRSVFTSMVTRPRRWGAAGVAVLLAVLVVFLGYVGWIGSERAIHPSPSTDVPTRAEYPQLRFEEVQFLSRDGTRLRGLFLRSRAGLVRDAGTIVLMHGYGNRKEQALPYANFLAGDGYNLLLFDFRGSGESAGDAVTVGALEQGDAIGALDYLEARGDVDMRRVGFFGTSMGGAVAIMAGAADSRVAAVVAEAPFKDVPSEVASSFEDRIGLPAFPFAPITVWITERRLGISASEISPLRSVPRLEGRPLLIIDDERDRSIAPGSARAVFEAAREPKAYWLAPASEHGKGHRDAREGYEREVKAFWARALPRGERLVLTGGIGSGWPPLGFPGEAGRAVVVEAELELLDAAFHMRERGGVAVAEAKHQPGGLDHLELGLEAVARRTLLVPSMRHTGIIGRY